MRHDQTPLYRSLAGLMLMVILRRKYVILSDGYFVSTCVTAVYARPRSHCSGSLELIKCFVVALLHELRILIQCHGNESFWNPRFRLHEILAAIGERTLLSLDPLLENLH